MPEVWPSDGSTDDIPATFLELFELFFDGNMIT